jgi:hypothetical protein
MNLKRLKKNYKMHKFILSILIGTLGAFFAFVGGVVAQEPTSLDTQIFNDVQQAPQSAQSGEAGERQSAQGSSTDGKTAEEIQAEQEVNVNSYLSDSVENEPQTQQELIEQLEVFLQLQFGGKLFNESASVGDLKMVIQDRFITPKKEINFLVFEQHVDDSYDFSEVEYTWTVQKGFTELFSYTEAGKNTFFYTFPESGSYGVDVVARFPDGRELKSLMTFVVLDSLTIDYEPFDIGAGDEITVVTERDIPNSVYRWVVDETEVNTTEPRFTFREYKGQGATYEVKLYVRNQTTDKLTHSGEITLQVGDPEAWIYLTDVDRGVEIDFADAIRINQASNLMMQVEPRGFGDDTLEYLFRVNGEEIVSETGNLELAVDPETEYEVEVLVRNQDSSKFSVREFVINQVTEESVLQANAQEFWDEIRGRYLSLGVFLSILIIGIVWIRIANT